MSKKEIFLRDLKNINIYIRLNSNTQNNLFLKFKPKNLNLSSTRFYGYKSRNTAFQLDLFLYMINKIKIKEEKFYKNIIELKYGERSKPIINPKLPIKKDPVYWNILFALFCDGTSDSWSEKHNRKIICPAYTSYSKEILDNFIKLIENKFGDFKYKINDGTIRIPLIIDTIFRNQHNINSFNTKSDKIPKFILPNRFEKELSNLDKLNKTAILIRYLVDEGDKSEISLNPRTIELGISNTSTYLIRIIKIILEDLKINYNIIKRERRSKNKNWKDAYQVKIARGKNRNNLKRLSNLLINLCSKYKITTLTNTQNNSLKAAIKYKYKKPIYSETHSKEIQFLIKEFLLTKKITNIREVNEMLINNGYNISRHSISNSLKKMPIEITKRAKRNIIYVNKTKLKKYIPFTKEQILKASLYEKVQKMYLLGKTISYISKRTDLSWSTIKSWVSGRNKPSILHGKWINEIN